MATASDGRRAWTAPPPSDGLGVLDGLTRGHFEEMARLEARFYGDDYITPPDEAYAWYLRAPDTTVVLADGRGRIAGFINMFPVRDGVYEALRSGTFNDRDLTANDVVVVASRPCGASRGGLPGQEGLAPGPRLHMFLSCVVVDDAYRRRSAGTAAGRLLREAVRRYEPVECLVDTVLVDNVTPDGVRFSRRWGFEPVVASDHGSQVFEQPYAAFARRVRAGGF